MKQLSNMLRNNNWYETMSEESVIISEPPKCVICNIYYSNEDCDNKCSECSGKELNTQCMICKINKSIPGYNFRCANCYAEYKVEISKKKTQSEHYETNLNDYFKYYMIEHEKKNKYILIDKQSKYEIFKSIVKKYCDSGENLRKFMLGTYEFPIVFMKANFSDKLLDYLLRRTKITNQYFGNYVHVVTQFTIDIWNMVPKEDIGIIDCYYRNFGELTECPSTLEEIIVLWNKYDTVQ